MSQRLLAIITALILVASAARPADATQHQTEPHAPVTAPWSGKVPLQSGKVDYPLSYTPGVVKVWQQPGVDIRRELNALGLTGTLTHVIQPPYSALDLAAGLDRSYKLEVPAGQEKAVALLLAPLTDKFFFVGLDWIDQLRAGFAPNDPQYFNGTQPYLAPPVLNMPRAWDRTISSSAITIAILDSGISTQHEEFAGKIRTGWDFVANTDYPAGVDRDGCGHGTFVASIAAGATNNGVGIAATGFNSILLPIKILDGTNLSNCVSPLGLNPADPIRQASAQGALVINMSYTHNAQNAEEAMVLQTAVQSYGATPVAIAGNGTNNNGIATTTPMYPCAYLYVICVTASNQQNSTRASFANYGPHVDFSAPGVAIAGAVNHTTNGYATRQGTSEAAPLVAGICALLRSIGKSPDAQMNALIASGQGQGRSDGYTSYGWVEGGYALWVP
jgi:thermitase